MELGEDPVALGRVEALRVPLLQVGGLEDGHVDMAFLEQVAHHHVGVVALELLIGPVRLGRTEAVIGVEAVDPPLGVLLLPGDPVVRTCVPVVDVGVDHEVALTIVFVHVGPPHRARQVES